MNKHILLNKHFQKSSEFPVSRRWVETLGLLAVIFMVSLMTSCKPKDTPEEDCPFCPRIDEISPNHGRTGDIITLRGINFGDFIEGVDKVSINGKPADLAAASTSTVMKIFVPEKCGTGQIIINIDGLSSTEWSMDNTFTYDEVVVHELVPNFGQPGDKVLIEGKFFDPNPEKNEVIFSGGTPLDPIRATVLRVGPDNKILEVEVPDGGETGIVQVTVDGHTAESAIFTYNTDVFVRTYNPTSGKAGDKIQIKGNNFSLLKIENTVTFTPSVQAEINQVLSDSLMEVFVPQGAETGPIKVERNEVVSEGPIFFIEQASISSLVPDHGRKGDKILIKGTNFSRVPIDNEVKFHPNIPAVVTDVTGDSVLEVVVPEGAETGPVKLTVDGITIESIVFIYDVVQVHTLLPDHGRKNDLIRIKGKYFDGEIFANNKVEFSGNQLAAIEDASDSTLDVRVPEGAQSGPITVTVDGHSATSSTFTFDAVLTVSTVFNGTGTGIRRPGPLTVDATGNLYFSDVWEYNIHKVTPAGNLSRYTGAGYGDKDGSANVAQFGIAYGLTYDGNGNLIFADAGYNKIKQVNSSRSVVTLGGSTAGYQDGPLAQALFKNPNGLAIDKNGNYYIADYLNHVIRKITPTGTVSTLAGTPGVFGHQDGTGTNAIFKNPRTIVYGLDGYLYVSDNYYIRKVSLNGVVTTVAGNGNFGSVDGPAAQSQVPTVSGIAADAEGNVYFTDNQADAIRVISNGTVSIFLGVNGAGNTDGDASVAQFRDPFSIIIDKSGVMYVTDMGNNTIRKISYE